MDTLLNAITVNQSTPYILTQGITSLFLEFFTLLWGTLVDLLHHRVWATNGGQPHMFGIGLVNHLNDFSNTGIGGQVKSIKQGAAAG